MPPKKKEISTTIHKSQKSKFGNHSFAVEVESALAFKQIVFEKYKNHIEGLVSFDEHCGAHIDTETEKTIENVGEYFQWCDKSRHSCNLKTFSSKNYEDIIKDGKVELRVYKYGPKIIQPVLAKLLANIETEINRAGAPTETEQSRMVNLLKEKHCGICPITNNEMAWGIWASYVLSKKSQIERDQAIQTLPHSFSHFFGPVISNTYNDFLETQQQQNSTAYNAITATQQLIKTQMMKVTSQLEELKKMENILETYKISCSIL